MNKKAILGTVIFILIIVVGVIVALSMPKNENNHDSNIYTENNIQNDIDKNDDINKDKKILVVYYSAQNHTKAVAEKISEKLNADIYEIVPKEVYSSEDLNWTNSNSRVSREHNDESLRNVELENASVENWDEYDTVLIGYPIWWGVAAWPVNSFVKENNFDGKKVIPFCTSASSGLGESGKLLENEANSGDWLEGQRFNSNPSDNDINKFIESIK